MRIPLYINVFFYFLFRFFLNVCHSAVLEKGNVLPLLKSQGTGGKGGGAREVGAESRYARRGGR